MNQVDIDVPFGDGISRLALCLWGFFVGALTWVPPRSLTWDIVIHDAASSLATYWIVRGLGRINCYRKERQQRAS